MRRKDRINIGVASEVVARYRQMHPAVKLSALVKLFLEEEIRRSEKEGRKPFDPYCPSFLPEIAPAQPVAAE